MEDVGLLLATLELEGVGVLGGEESDTQRVARALERLREVLPEALGDAASSTELPVAETQLWRAARSALERLAAERDAVALLWERAPRPRR